MTGACWRWGQAVPWPSRQHVPSRLAGGDGAFLLPCPTGSGADLALQQSTSAGSTAMLEKSFLHPLQVRAGFPPGRGSSLASLHSVLLFFLLGTTRCLIFSTAQLLVCAGPLPGTESIIVEDFPLQQVTNDTSPPPRRSRCLS